MLRLKAFRNLKGVQTVTNYYRQAQTYARNTYLNKQLDKIGFQIKDNFFEIREAMDESLWWRKYSRRLTAIVKFTLMGFLICDLGNIIKDRVWIEPSNIDFIADPLAFGSSVDSRFLQAYDRILSDHISKEGMNTLEWLSIGQRFAEGGLAEYAFHSFYMAHLLNPRLIKTNSDLQFDTSLPPNTPAARPGSNLDDILNTLLNSD